MAKTKAAETTKTERRYCIVGNEGYGLYVGWVEATDAEILAAKAVRLYEARHVRYWYGGTGGITSLAAWGPCGPRAKESRIGAPCPSSLLTEVRAIHECTPEARAAFDAIAATR